MPAFDRDAIDERRRAEAAQIGSGDLGQQAREVRGIAELHPGGVPAQRQEQIPRQRDVRIARMFFVTYARLRPFQDLLDRDAGVGGDRDERGVGAVLQEPAHQVGEEIAVAADRRIDPAQRGRRIGEQRVIERLAHAVQALELVAVDPAGILDQARDGERIVGAELRQELRPRRQQGPRASQITYVCQWLTGKDRVVGKAALLRPLDLGVPVGALDQAHDQPPVEAAGELGEPVDHRAGTLLVGLHGGAEPAPAGERGIGRDATDDRERKLEPVGLLGVDHELEVMRLGALRQPKEPRRQLGQHPLARQRLVARVQRGELDRDPGRPGRAPPC